MSKSLQQRWVHPLATSLPLSLQSVNAKHTNDITNVKGQSADSGHIHQIALQQSFSEMWAKEHQDRNHYIELSLENFSQLLPRTFATEICQSYFLCHMPNNAGISRAFRSHLQSIAYICISSTFVLTVMRTLSPPPPPPHLFLWPVLQDLQASTHNTFKGIFKHIHMWNEFFSVIFTTQEIVFVLCLQCLQ